MVISASPSLFDRIVLVCGEWTWTDVLNYGWYFLLPGVNTYQLYTGEYGYSGVIRITS
jgi:hypothetical protein